MFCKEHSNSIAPISVLTTIMSKNNQEKSEKISKEFARLGFTKIKDLAQSTLEKASSMNFGVDPLTELYNAIKDYDAQLEELWKSASKESGNGNFVRTRQICHEILLQKPDDLRVLVLKANAYFQLEKYDKSIRCLKDALKVNPICANVLNSLGSNYWKKCQYDLAIDYFSAAVTIKPHYTKGLIDYAEALVATNDMKGAKFAYLKILSYEPQSNSIRKKYGKVLIALGEIADAKHQLEIALKHAPNDTDILNNLANTCSLSGELDNCISFYHQALEINSNLEETWCDLGIAYSKSENFKSAISAFYKALYLNPENVFVMKNLAAAFIFDENIPMAVETYRKYLKLEPNNLNINYELASLYVFELKNLQSAEPYLEKCVELHSQSEYVYKLLTNVYKNLNKFGKASDTCILLGDLYLTGNRLEQAKYTYQYALFFNPENSIGEWKVGLALFKLEDIDSALSRFKKAIDLDPNFADAYFDSALAYEKFDDSNKAFEFYEKALELKPTNLKYLHNMSRLKRKLGQFNEAVDFINKILECEDSDHLNVHMDLANMLYKEMNNPYDALIHYEKALTYDNSCFKIYITMGNILAELKRSNDAIKCFNKAIELDPLYTPAYISLSSVYKDCGNFMEAINSYDHALQQESEFKYYIYCDLVLCLQRVCDWSDYDSDMEKLNEILKEQLDNDKVLSLLPHDYLLLPLSIEVQKQIAANYSKQCVEKLKNLMEEPEQFVHQTSNSSTNGPLKIGIVSSCFGKEPISTIVQSIYGCPSIVENEIEVFCYASSSDNIPSWVNFLKTFNHFRDLSKLKVYDAAKAINKDGINILVDLNTNGVQTEIFAFRPAPVQVSWVGYYPCTIGSSYMDYLITDKICSPPVNDYTEKLAYVNETVFVGDHKHTFQDFSREYYSRQQYNLPEDVVVFCNFSQPNKIDPNTFRMWVDILNQVPDSVLWLLRWNDDAEKNINKFAEQLYFDTSRIIFSDIVPKDQHMRRIHLADIYLDTLLYNGNIACLDAIWSGIPIITLPGETYASRITASQLTALGFIETIAESKERYIRHAVQCGLDSEMLKNIKRYFEELKMESNLFNVNSYAIEITKIFKKLWSEHE